MGRLDASYTYDAYGTRSCSVCDGYGSSFGFTGQYEDREGGLLYMRGRYYDPSTQQFITRDPAGSTSQPYVYANANPINYVDARNAVVYAAINRNVYANANPINYVDPTGAIGIPLFFQTGPGRGPGDRGGMPPTRPGAGTGGRSGGPGGGSGGATLASEEAVEAGMKQLRQAIAKGEIRPINSKKYAGQVYKFKPGSELAKKYPEGVRFTEDGFPDFSPYARVTVKIRMKATSSDFSAANRAGGWEAARDFGAETWHHVEDRITMQLVPYDLHWAVKHTGGEAIIRHLGELP